MSSRHVYYDTSDPRQYLVWTNTSSQTVTTRLNVHAPQGNFPAPFCDVYDLDLTVTLGSGKPYIEVFLEVAIKDNLIALLVGIEPVEYVGGCGLEPANLATVAWHDGEA